MRDVTEQDGRVELDGERRRVYFERRYAVSVEQVWDALTTPERLARWLAPTTVAAGEGGRIEHDFGDDGTCGGTVLRWEPPHLLEYEWRFPGEGESILRFTLTPDGPEATVLELEHRRLDADQGEGYGAGWHAYLDLLAAEIAGAPLPNWDERFAAALPRYRA